MKEYQHNKSSLFLMEIIINILFFSLLATFCLQIFFKAYQMSKDTSRLHKAVNVCTSVAEICQSEDQKGLVLKQVYPEADIENDVMNIYFDSSFSPCKKSESEYVVTVKWDRGTETEMADIAIKDESEEENIYEVSASCYKPGGLSTSGGEKDE